MNKFKVKPGGALPTSFNPSVLHYWAVEFYTFFRIQLVQLVTTLYAFCNVS